MARFRKGMLGLTIAIVAIMGSVLLGFATSVTETTEREQRWDYLGDISGLFDYSKEPQYVEYNPAANWTGYNDLDRNHYNYETSDNANLYPIINRSEPVEGSLNLLDSNHLFENPIVDRTGAYIDDDSLFISDERNPNGASHIMNGYAGLGIKNPRTVNQLCAAKLSDIIPLMGLSAQDNQVIINLQTEQNFIVSKITDWTDYTWTDPGSSQKHYCHWLDLTEAAKVTKIVIDPSTLTARGYDNSGNTRFVSYCSDIALSFNSKKVSNGATFESGGLGKVLTFQKVQVEPTEYLDTSKGIQPLQDCSWKNGYANSSASIVLNHTTGQSNEATTFVLLSNYYVRFSIGWLGNELTLLNYNLNGVGSVGMDFFGNWNSVEVTIDTIHGFLEITPIVPKPNFGQFDFNNYDLSKPVLKIWFDPVGTFEGMNIDHYSSLYTMPYMGITGTTMFLDTYDAVIKNPNIDITDYYPLLTDLPFKLNFYSFAITGETFTVKYSNQADGSVTFPVIDGLMTIDNVDHELNNMVIYSENGKIYIDFLNEIAAEPILILDNMAAGDNFIISATGNWSFTTGLYEGQDVTVKKMQFDPTNFSFDSNAVILVYMALLIIGSLVGRRFAGLGGLDLIVIAFAGLCGFVLMM